MWLIAGLGNPGSRYTKTRHNIGFELIDRLSSSSGIQLRESDLFLRGGGQIEDVDVVLLKPLTYMNRSGIVVKDTLYKYSIPINNLIVVHDDLDLEPGLIKLKKNGSSGGHKGIESIIMEVRSRDFIRLKIGIGRDHFTPADVYVLNRFKSSERETIEGALETAESALVEVLTRGIDAAMNRFNKKNRPKNPETENSNPDKQVS